MLDSFTIQGFKFSNNSDFVMLEAEMGVSGTWSTLRLGSASISGYKVPYGKNLKLKGLWVTDASNGLIAVSGFNDVANNSPTEPVNPVYEVSEFIVTRPLSTTPALIDFTVPAHGYPAIKSISGTGKGIIVYAFGILEDDGSPPEPLPDPFTGADGITNITSDTFIDLDTKDIYDFTDLYIAAGKKLTLVSSDARWGTIGCTTSCVIDGTLEYRNKNNGLIQTKTAPDGALLTYQIIQKLGGRGGNNTGSSGGGNKIVNGGDSLVGIGGGGAGGNAFATGDVVIAKNGGFGGRAYINGGNGVGSSPSAVGGVGGFSITDSNGADGQVGDAPPPPYGGDGGDGSGGGGGGAASASAPPAVEYAAGGGGGGGGDKGYHGGGLYLRCLCPITGSGQINLNGTAGYNGGSGKDGARTASGSTRGGGGGGGGGGAGGSGGTLVLKYSGSMTPSTNVTGGAAGGGGNRGRDKSTAELYAEYGVSGEAGNVGSVIVLP